MEIWNLMFSSVFVACWLGVVTTVMNMINKDAKEKELVKDPRTADALLLVSTFGVFLGTVLCVQSPYATTWAALFVGVPIIVLALCVFVFAHFGWFKKVVKEAEAEEKSAKD